MTNETTDPAPSALDRQTLWDSLVSAKSIWSTFVRVYSWSGGFIPRTDMLQLIRASKSGKKMRDILEGLSLQDLAWLEHRAQLSYEQATTLFRTVLIHNVTAPIALILFLTEVIGTETIINFFNVDVASKGDSVLLAIALGAAVFGVSWGLIAAVYTHSNVIAVRDMRQIIAMARADQMHAVGLIVPQSGTSDDEAEEDAPIGV